MSAPWVFVHGWGFTPAIWSRIAPAFPAATMLSLPGHAGAPLLPACEWVAALRGMLPEKPCIGVGWSLGGMLLLAAAAKEPWRFRGLVLVAAAASFVRRKDWPWGVAESALAGFAEEAALRRFYLLALGARRDAALFGKHAPPAKARAEGLGLLRALDLRGALAGLALPTLWMAGARDAVLPAQAVRASARLGRGMFVCFQEAGHAPMWTHPVSFMETLRAWTSAFLTP